MVRVHVGPPFNWGCSSAGRAIPLHGIGRRFDPCQLHKFYKNFKIFDNLEINAGNKVIIYFII